MSWFVRKHHSESQKVTVKNHLWLWALCQSAVMRNEQPPEQERDWARLCPPAWLISEAGYFPPPHPSVLPSPPAAWMMNVGQHHLNCGCHQFPFPPQAERWSWVPRVLYWERFLASSGSSCSKTSSYTPVLSVWEFCIWRLKEGSLGKLEGIRMLLLTVAAYRRRKRKSTQAQKNLFQLKRPQNVVGYRLSVKSNNSSQKYNLKKQIPGGG